MPCQQHLDFRLAVLFGEKLPEPQVLCLVEGLWCRFLGGGNASSHSRRPMGQETDDNDASPLRTQEPARDHVCFDKVPSLLEASAHLRKLGKDHLNSWVTQVPLVGGVMDPKRLRKRVRHPMKTSLP